MERYQSCLKKDEQHVCWLVPVVCLSTALVLLCSLPPSFDHYVDFKIHFESSVLKKEVCVNKLRQSITTWNKKQGCKVELRWAKMLRGGGSCVSKILRWPRKNLLRIDFGKELPQPLHLMRQNCIKNTFFKKWGGF